MPSLPEKKYTDTMTMNKKQFGENWEKESHQNPLVDTVVRELSCLKHNSASVYNTNLKAQTKQKEQNDKPAGGKISRPN